MRAAAARPRRAVRDRESRLRPRPPRLPGRRRRRGARPGRRRRVADRRPAGGAAGLRHAVSSIPARRRPAGAAAARPGGLGGAPRGLDRRGRLRRRVPARRRADPAPAQPRPRSGDLCRHGVEDALADPAARLSRGAGRPAPGLRRGQAPDRPAHPARRAGGAGRPAGERRLRAARSRHAQAQRRAPGGAAAGCGGGVRPGGEGRRRRDRPARGGVVRRDSRRPRGVAGRRGAGGGIGLYPVSPLYAPAGPRPAVAGFVLGYAGLGEDEIRRGVAALAAVVAGQR